MDSSFPSSAPWNSCGQSPSSSHVIVSEVRFGSDAEGSGVPLSVTTDKLHRPDSLKMTSLASSVNGERTWNSRRVFRLVARAISETAAVIIRSPGRYRRSIFCKLGHNVGNLETIEATIALGQSDPNPREIEVTRGERRKGRN